MFNLAMLGKQGWRLLENPNSLCARVLKGRYYHDGEFMTATRRKHASHTWRAILEGQEVLKKGLLKRIGDGTMTNIWRDRWIPNHFSGRPLVVHDDPQVHMVADLLTPSGVWNGNLIRQVFASVDANAILATPIKGHGPDVWAWEPERHGLYTVKSAYHKLYNAQNQQADEGRASGSDDKIWKRIWRMCVPPKVQVFWWRVVNDYLPTKGILHRRHIEPIPNCEICGADEESIQHALMECTVAKSFWAKTRKLTGVKMPKLHPDTWAHDLVDLNICPPKNAAVILCGMWSLWMARNKRHHGEAPWPVRMQVQWATDTAFDLWKLAHPSKGESEGTRKGSRVD